MQPDTHRSVRSSDPWLHHIGFDGSISFDDPLRPLSRRAIAPAPHHALSAHPVRPPRVLQDKAKVKAEAKAKAKANEINEKAAAVEAEAQAKEKMKQAALEFFLR